MIKGRSVSGGGGGGGVRFLIITRNRCLSVIIKPSANSSRHEEHLAIRQSFCGLNILSTKHMNAESRIL